ncbi:ABC transporter D family member 2, chloroplastic [Porphyridium purpureum]|uniref:Probable ATP-dependent transporter ycf16 n=1 Tax=Porphyridium purpureum TaxID=35688 RepID=A0A5J4Z0H5_PORPP|nr:ABC transporter D family member 2, chloroplastic [Porphyridium purpureum]|eukprot:POR1380..scf208_2
MQLEYEGWGKEESAEGEAEGLIEERAAHGLRGSGNAFIRGIMVPAMAVAFVVPGISGSGTLLHAWRGHAGTERRRTVERFGAVGRGRKCTSWGHSHGMWDAHSRRCRQAVLMSAGGSGNGRVENVVVEGDQDETTKLSELRTDIRRVGGLFLTLAKPYWKQDPSAKWQMARVVALAALQAGVSVGFSYVGRDFWNALSTKNVEQFQQEAALFFGLLVIGTPVAVLYAYSRDMLSLSWRQWLTESTLMDYFKDRNYYKIEAYSTVDNPDQRITEDLDAFTRTSLLLFLTVLTSIVDLICFSGILLSIYPPLFAVIIGYAGFGTITTASIGKDLVNINFRQLQKEADLRYALVRVRENAESVAFYGGEDRELGLIRTRLQAAVENFGLVIKKQRNLEFFTVGYKYLIQVLPALVTAPLFFEGKVGLGVVNQSFSAFNHILNDLSIIVNKFEQISRFGAGIDRLGEFVEELELEITESTKTVVASTGREDEDSQRAATEVGEDRQDSLSVSFLDDFSGLVLRNVTLVTPDETRRKLSHNVSLSLEQGKRLLIVGPSGTGKSSLLRAVAGLWTSGQGEIIRPSTEQTFFLPQKPYCTLGTLREQLLYPMAVDLKKASQSDAILLETLKLVDLASLPERMGGLDSVRDWSDILSLGEQQRLAFARLILNKPKMAILDEASSALDLKAEERLYDFLFSSGVTYVSVGHRPSLVRYHDTILRLGATGWSVEQIDNARREAVVMAQL